MKFIILAKGPFGEHYFECDAEDKAGAKWIFAHTPEIMDAGYRPDYRTVQRSQEAQ